MNEERLCPMCCENKTRGTICTKCCQTFTGGCWGEAGKQWYIRGVPASQAKCPQEERAQVSTEYKEKLYVLQPNIEAVHFYCRTCGTQLALAHVEDTCTNNLFCFCGRQYWVDWQEGILHMGIDNDQLMEYMADQLRANGMGRAIF